MTSHSLGSLGEYLQARGFPCCVTSCLQWRWDTIARLDYICHPAVCLSKQPQKCLETNGPGQLSQRVLQNHHPGMTLGWLVCTEKLAVTATASEEKTNLILFQLCWYNVHIREFYFTEKVTLFSSNNTLPHWSKNRPTPVFLKLEGEGLFLSPLLFFCFWKKK